MQEVEFRLEQSFRREEDDKRRQEELESFGVKIVEEMLKKGNAAYARNTGMGRANRRESRVLEPKIPRIRKKLDSAEPSDRGNSGAQSPSARAEEDASKEPVRETDKEDSK